MLPRSPGLPRRPERGPRASPQPWQRSQVAAPLAEQPEAPPQAAARERSAAPAPLPRLRGLFLELVFVGGWRASSLAGWIASVSSCTATLDHDGHDQHDRSSERDRRAPAQPRARACRAAARDSSARLCQHATIELGRHVLAAELAIALRNVGAPFQVLVQRLDVDRVAHDCTLGSNCRGRCWRSAVRSLPTA